MERRTGKFLANPICRIPIVTPHPDHFWQFCINTQSVPRRLDRLKFGAQSIILTRLLRVFAAGSSHHGSMKHKESNASSQLLPPDPTNRQSVCNTVVNTPAAKAEYKRLQEDRRLVLLLVAIVAMFFICVTPAAILLILPVADADFGLGLKLFRAFANLLELTNYALNFYVYVGCSSDFRTTFANVFCSKCSKQNQNGDAMEQSMITNHFKKGTATNASNAPLLRPPPSNSNNNHVNLKSDEIFV